MVWNASDMLASTGAAMPDSYVFETWELEAQEEQHCEETAAFWSEHLGKTISIKKNEARMYDLNVGGLHVLFPHISDLEGWLERMYPPKRTGPENAVA